MLGRVRLTMTVTNVAVVAVVVVALLITAFFVAQRVITRNADRELINIAESVQQTAGRSGFGASGNRGSPFFRPPGRSDDAVRVDLREFGRRDPPVEFAVFTPDGETVLAFLELPDNLPLNDDVQRALDGERQISTVDVDGAPLRVVSQPITDREGAVIAVVQVAESRQAQDQIVNTLRNVLIAVGGGGLVFAGVVGYVLTGRSMRPVNIAFERQKAFVADAAHELRTPLAIISANAEALEMDDSSLREADRELLSGIRTESSYLAALVTKLLDMAKLDFEDDRLHGEVDLARTVTDACAAMSVIAEARGITLEAPTADGPLAIRGDQVLVRLIVLSLLDNAIKYNSENGTVSVELDSTGSTASVRIRDTGPGIPQEHLGRVFDRFYRVDKARSRQTGGAGLGLAIARRAAEVIQGQLDLASKAGSGTVATVRFERLSPTG